MRTSFTFLLFVLLIVISGNSAFAQNAKHQEIQTLFDKSSIYRVGGFGGPIVEFSKLYGEFAVSNGGGGGLIINNLFVGGYGLGISTNHHTGFYYTHPASSSSYPQYYGYDRVNFGHGGFWLGYAHQPYKAVHLALSSKIGWGAISLNDTKANSTLSLYNIVDEVFVFQPQLETQLNLTKWFRVNVGVGYRFVNGIDKKFLDISSGALGWKPYFKRKDFNSVTGSIGFYFGKF
jgi:hypothetical protein